MDAQPPGPAAVAGPDPRDALAHLAADWDAQAAQIERSVNPAHYRRIAQAEVLRECAEQLRDRIGLPGDT